MEKRRVSSFKVGMKVRSIKKKKKKEQNGKVMLFELELKKSGG